MYYKLVKEQSASGGHFHQTIFFCFCSATKTDQANRIFSVIKSYKSNTGFYTRFINARDNGVSSIGSLIAIVKPDPIKYYINGVPIIVSNKKEILMLPMNHSLISMHNGLEAIKPKYVFI